MLWLPKRSISTLKLCIETDEYIDCSRERVRKLPSHSLTMVLNMCARLTPHCSFRDGFPAPSLEIKSRHTGRKVNHSFQSSMLAALKTVRCKAPFTYSKGPTGSLELAPSQDNHNDQFVQLMGTLPEEAAVLPRHLTRGRQTVSAKLLPSGPGKANCLTPLHLLTGWKAHSCRPGACHFPTPEAFQGAKPKVLCSERNKSLCSLPPGFRMG